MVTGFMTAFMGSSVNIALPAIGREFSIDAITLSWIATAFMLTSVVLMIPLGKAADIRGRKKVFLTGILIFTAACLFSAIAWSAPVLILSRVLNGVGSAMVFGTSTAILTSVFPPEKRGKVLGYSVSSVYFGLSAGPFLGGMLTHDFGWRSIFLIAVPLGIAVCWITVSALKSEWSEAKGERFDWPGSIVYGLMIVAIIYGMTKLPSVQGMISIGIGLVFLAVFVGVELKAIHPVFDIRLLTGNKAFGLSNLAALIHYSSTFAVGFLLSFYLQYIKGMSPQGAGLILIAQPVFMALFSPLAGRISDRVNAGVVASIGMAITFGGILILNGIDETMPLWRIVTALVVIGLGFAFFSSPNTNVIMGSVERKFYGVASGTLGTMRQMGQITGMAITMMLFSLFIGQVRITPEHYPGFLAACRGAFTIFAVTCFAAIFASLARNNAAKNTK
jgi:EmrB/QacA subfamily drug resistance transporter